MKASPLRRKIIVIVLLALALVGAGVRHWAPNPSVARDMGTLLLVLWLPIIGNVVAYFVNRYRSRRKPLGAFGAGRPFASHLAAELAPAGAFARGAPLPLAADECCCTLVVGSEGFTARLDIPLMRWLASGQSQAVQVEFLRPALAGPRFPAGASFRVLAGRALAGEGRVVGLPT